MQKRFFKLCSVFMVLILLANMLPLRIFAEAFQASLSNADISVVAPEVTTSEAAYVVDELVEKRTEFSNW